MFLKRSFSKIKFRKTKKAELGSTHLFWWVKPHFYYIAYMSSAEGGEKLWH